MSKVNPHRRLRSETVDIEIQIDDGSHKFEVSLAYDDVGILREIAFVGRGKCGGGLDHILRELGIQLSRAIQGRNPMTGEV